MAADLPSTTHNDGYAGLTPQAVLDALQAAGLYGDGRLLQLNSYENRVFQVFLEDGSAVVAKFYRPGRWTDAQILEEHAFALELAAQDIPMVPPLPLPDGSTLGHVTLEGTAHRFSVSPRRAGRAPELDDPDTLQWLGRFIARIHAVGRQQAFVHRRRLDIVTFGHRPRQLLLDGGFVPDTQRAGWQAACDAVLARVEQAFADAGDIALLRLHGDCHPGNVLWREGEGPHFVDLDDACTGPAIQDLWMLMSGDRAGMTRQLSELLDGYLQFMPFDRRELQLIEPLRTLRMIHHSAWLAERWGDPAFPAAFPYFGSAAYWSEQTTQLREQLEAMDEPPLEVY
ncbi:serine/threonine protein kinase [Ideonella sp. BN130291]|uniref:serine/threonine protein kinase n=1 Tax=Ideonella sp. BN130291 TaxID=3112940 RepID=UPI002E2674F8|nr:serine/threonine protein kinase [Ideonella sp. BN130291]